MRRCTDERLLTLPCAPPSPRFSMPPIESLDCRWLRCREYRWRDAASPRGFHQNQYTSPMPATMASTPPSAAPIVEPSVDGGAGRATLSWQNATLHSVQVRTVAAHVWDAVQLHSGAELHGRHDMPLAPRRESRLLLRVTSIAIHPISQVDTTRLRAYFKLGTRKLGRP